MAALAQTEREIKRKRITDSVVKRRSAGKNLSGRRPALTDFQARKAVTLIEAGESAPRVARNLGIDHAAIRTWWRALF
jgi:DNA invertase Pin-like site-specific DNA recombinase